MGSIAKGIAKTLALKNEPTYGALAGATGAQLLRRVTSTIDLNRDKYDSKEIRSDQQVADANLGTHRVAGNINGELSLATYKALFAASLRKAWTTGPVYTASTGDGLTVSNSGKTFTRVGGSSGSFLTDGFKVGMVVRVANVAGVTSQNYRITALTALIMTVAEAPGTDVGAADEDATITTVGSMLWVPTSGHTDDSFNIEHHFSDISTVEVFLGMQVNQIQLGLPSTGNATFQAAMLGQDMNDDPNGDTSAPYFTSPTAETTTEVLRAVNGKLRLAGSDVASVTGMNLTINSNITGDPVIGSNLIPEMFPGRVTVTGQFTAYYRDGDLMADFKNETELSLSMLMATAGGSPVDFMALSLSRIKLTGVTKDDGEKGLIQTVPFQALLRTDGGTGTAYEKTTIMLQDSSF